VSTSGIENAIVYITDTIDGVQWQGSGVLIAPDEVLTAAHMVYNSATRSEAQNIVVTPGYDAGSAPFGSATGAYANFNPIQDANDNISEYDSQNDFAVIHLSQPFTSITPMSIAPGYPGGSVTVSGYPAVAGGVLVDETEVVTQDQNFALLDGRSIGPGSSGGPVWSTPQGTGVVVGLISSAAGGTGSAGYFTQITQGDYAQIMRWVQQDEAGSSGTAAATVPTPTATPSPTLGLAVLDMTTGGSMTAAAQPYSGPVVGVQDQYINVSTHSLNVTASTPNWFVHSGSGNDAIAVSSGTNVLDGGTGSNFLTGGSGTDTFFVDDRDAPADIWSTVNNFHSGDAATIWGVSPSLFTFNWVDGQGATGYKGLTLHVTDPGVPTASLTLSGYGSADLTNGRLAISYGLDTASGSNYMYVKAT
jgi:V8-like Glu-specific endopeptidase